MKKKTSDDFEYEQGGSGRITAVVESEEEAPKAEVLNDVRENGLGEVTFKKALHGYNIQEVTEYIDNQNSFHESTCKMYDGKIEELRSEIAFLNRERESLLSKLEITRAELEQAKAAPAKNDEPEDNAEQSAEGSEDKEKYEEIQKMVKVLVSKNEALAAEVVSLRNERAENEIELVKLRDNGQALDDVRSVKSGLEDEVSLLNSQLREKDGEIQRLSTIEREHGVLVEESVELKRLYTDEQEKRAKAEAELHDKEKRLVLAGSEQEQLRKELSEFEIRQSILRQQLKKADNDITEIRDQSKRQAYAYANKANEIEAEFTAKKLQMQKQMQVHQYHIKQVGLLLDQIKSQYEDACSSLDDPDLSEK